MDLFGFQGSSKFGNKKKMFEITNKEKKKKKRNIEKTEVINCLLNTMSCTNNPTCYNCINQDKYSFP